MILYHGWLDKLGLEAPPPPKLKKYFLGSFLFITRMERIEGENEEDKANKGSEEEESVFILQDEYESDDYINSNDPEINEPDLAEEYDKVEEENNDPVQTSSKKKGSSTNQNNSNEQLQLVKV
ncbi:uncharacterized protein VP01_13101g1 [Puccinia sorghi]|uniref:Uncharacterized protein n=1 Tax=Puccinia sorghi TaxID=27349 RepID=A0A0L6VNF9_9BASI|nr:uncharacterized protein VP01_13101g1 [Puccinia sorghi]